MAAVPLIEAGTMVHYGGMCPVPAVERVSLVTCWLCRLCTSRSRRWTSWAWWWIRRCSLLRRHPSRRRRSSPCRRSSWPPPTTRATAPRPSWRRSSLTWPSTSACCRATSASGRRVDCGGPLWSAASASCARRTPACQRASASWRPAAGSASRVWCGRSAPSWTRCAGCSRRPASRPGRPAPRGSSGTAAARCGPGAPSCWTTPRRRRCRCRST